MVEQVKESISKDYPYTKTDIVEMRDSSTTDDLPPSDASSGDNDGSSLVVNKLEGGSSVGLDVVEDDEIDMLDEDDDDDDEGSTSGPFTTGSETTGDSNRLLSKGIERIAPQEDYAVFWAETVAITLIVLITIAVATCLAVTTSNEEKKAFQDDFNSYAAIIEVGSKSHWHGQQEAMSAFTRSLTFSTKKSINNNDTWPTVTVPSELFFGQGSDLLVPRYVDSYLLAPIVDRSLIPTWESYSHDHSTEWIEAGVDTFNSRVSVSTASTFQQRYRHLANDEISSSYIAPIWQHYPVQPEWVNYDLASDPHIGGAGLINATLFSKHRGAVLMGPTLFTTPISPLLPTAYPILESSLSSGVDPQETVVGILVGLTRWSQILSSMGTNVGSVSSSKTNNSTSHPLGDDQQLPPDMIAVVKNVCSQVQDDHDDVDRIFSLAISHPRHHQQATYLGQGDLHNHQFDTMGYTYSLHMGEDIDGTSHPCTVDGSSGNYYSITLYPTSDMQASYETNRPWVYALVASAVGMVLLLAVLYSYWRVRRRHQIVSIEAFQSRTVVASLFPSSVHDRIFQRTGSGPRVGNASTTHSKGGMNPPDAIPKSPETPRGEGDPGGNDKSRTGGLLGLLSLQSSFHSNRSFCSSCPSPVRAVDSVPCKTKSVTTSAAGSSEDNFGEQHYDVDDDEEDVILNDERGIPPLRGSTHAGPKKPHSQRSLRSDDYDTTADVDDDDDVDRHKRSSSRSLRLEPPMQRLRTFLSELPAYSTDNSIPNTSSRSLSRNSSRRGIGGTGRSDDAFVPFADEPIADLFPECTVMFADISGFTAWSSVREPTQVFKLLEAIYRGFDKLAKKRGVFKVETIGDCYVAVTGLPDPQPEHAIIMSKFAKESMQKMTELVRHLEVSLGPDTADLCMRYGLHSGPVTAGVLRGEKSRFQLFGDTVNFASRMESTGQRNKIQCSQATADLLVAGGKKHWVHTRDDVVHAKGKGNVQTYWIVPRSNPDGGLNGILNSPIGPRKTSSIVYLKSKRKGGLSNHLSSPKRLSSDHTKNSSRRNLIMSSLHVPEIWSTSTHDKFDSVTDDYDGFEDTNRQERLIEWNVEILSELLRRIVAHRETNNIPLVERGYVFTMKYEENKTALDEVTEIIPLGGGEKVDTVSGTTDNLMKLNIDPDTIVLPQEVEEQLREYIGMIACMYRDNAFHCFEHASHVLNSVQKLLNRVVTADLERADSAQGNFYTSRISSDPLTQFAIVFSALIHDVDHTGVTNGQLIKDNAAIANLYKNKSVAEQNSCDLAWELLMDPLYQDLQLCIFGNESEFKRFRQLVVNVVLATDIFDQGMTALRNSRWEKAFQQQNDSPTLSEDDEFNLKGTIVLEYIMQASDVSHTMQHWHVYTKWNEKLFEETYSAFLSGRGEKDPSVGWYKGELWFFDNYVIPLARKLKECQVFGAASDVCLNYAISNRTEWERKGEEIVNTYISKVKSGFRMG